MVQNKLPLIQNAHDSETRNIINELIITFNRMGYSYELSVRMAIDILEQNKDVQKQIDNVIKPIADPNSEVAQARGDFDLLYKRLESFNKRFQQIDYVDAFSKYAQKGRMQLKKVNSLGAFEVSVFGDESHLTYRFMPNGDDFLVQSWVWSGGYTEIVVPSASFLASQMNFTGDFIIPSNTAVGYTEKPGDTFSVNFDVSASNSSVSFNFFKNSRGGVWKLTLNDGAEFTFSTFSSVTKNEEVIAFSGLNIGNYTIVAEFLGDDPEHSPATSPSRGWIQNTTRPFFNIGDTGIDPIKEVTLKNPSNIEFAFEVKPVGATETNFIPSHGVATAFSADPFVIKDGKREINVHSMENFEVIIIEDFSIEQHVYGRHPETGTQNLMEIWTNTKVDNKTGVLSIDGKMNTLETLTFANGYSLMGVAAGDIFDTVVSSFGNQFEMTSNYGNNIAMPEERDWAESYAFLSSSEKELGIAFKFNNVSETLRQGGSGKDANPETMSYINNRSEHIRKIYSRLYNNALVPSGEVLRWSGEYTFVTGTNVYDLYRLS